MRRACLLAAVMMWSGLLPAQNAGELYSKFMDELARQDFSSAAATGAAYMKQSQGKDTVYLEVLRYTSFCYYNLAQYDSAAAGYERARSLTATLKGTENYEYVMCSFNLAVNCSYIRAFSRSFELMNEVIDFIVKDQTRNSEDYINSTTLLANIYTMAGCVEKAAKTYEQVYDVIKANYTENDSAYQAYTNTIAAFYFQNGMYDRAEPFYRQAVAVMEKAYGTLSMQYLTTLNSLGEFLLYAGKYKAMEEVYRQYVDLCREFFGKKTADYATALNNLAVALEKQGKLKEAGLLYRECIDLKEKVFTKQSGFYALTLSNYAVLCDKSGRYAEAEKYYNEALSIYRKVYGEDNDQYHTTLSNMATLYSSSGRYGEAIEMLKTASDLQKKKYGEKYNGYIVSVTNLAQVYQDAGRYEQADSVFIEAIRLNKLVNGESHTDYATGLEGLAHLKMLQGRYADAEDLLARAAEIQKNAVGEDHPSYINCLNSQANMYFTMGNFYRAGKIYEECGEKYRNLYGPQHPEYATFLNNYGQFFFESGDPVQAEKYLKEALAVLGFALGIDHPDNAHMLITLANIKLHSGNLKEAENYIQTAVKITRERLGEDHPDYLSALAGMGVFYYEAGNYNKSERCYTDAQEKLKAVNGELSPQYIQVLNNLGALYMARCAQAADSNEATRWALKAEPCFLQVLRSDSIMIGTNHPDYALHLNNLAEFYRNTAQYAKSEAMHLKAIECEKKVFGEDYPSLAVSYHNIGLLYAATKDYVRAEEYCRKSLRMKEALYGPDNPVCSDVLASTAYVVHRSGNVQEADSLYRRAQQLNTKRVRESFAFLSEDEKAAYLATLSHYNDMYASFVMSLSNPPEIAIESLLNQSLVYKSMLLRAGNEMRRKIMAGNQRDLLTAYNEWLGLRRQIAKLYGMPEKDRYMPLEELEEKANNIEKKLVAATSAIPETEDDPDNRWKKIRESLSVNQSAVEFGHYRFLENDNTYQDYYYAIIIRSGSVEPAAVPLFAEKDFVKTVGKNTGTTFSAVSARYATPGLYRMIWGPIDSLLKSSSSVVISPDGILHAISFAALKDSSGICLSDRYRLQITTSLTGLPDVSAANGLPPRPDACVIGGALYDVDEQHLGGWPYLEGTLYESENIAKMLAGVGVSVKKWVGTEASEGNLKQLDGEKAPSVLHVATHGFFYPAPGNQSPAVTEEPVLADVMFRGAAGAAGIFSSSPNPMMRSGLILAGANRVWTGTSVSGEDGVLTAYEVSNLNLSRTRLVVLSACETGLGDIQGSEGVYGLLRAFRIAGVKNTIISLWQVPDKETAEFMETFYTKLIILKNIRSAFLETQAMMRKKYDPYFWAAFVLME